MFTLNHLYYVEYLRIEIDRERDGEGGRERERERDNEGGENVCVFVCEDNFSDKEDMKI